MRIIRHNMHLAMYLNMFNMVMDTPVPGKELAQISTQGAQWMQDPFYVLQSDTNGIAILDPHYVSPLHLQGKGGIGPLSGSFLARELAAAESITLKPTQYLFEGGNVLAGNDFVLMGSISFVVNWMYYRRHPWHGTFREMAAKLCRAFGTKMLLVPGLMEDPDEGRPGPAGIVVGTARGNRGLSSAAGSAFSP